MKSITSAYLGSILLMAISMVTESVSVRADHASDLQRCAAISNETQRQACLSLIVPAGGSASVDSSAAPAQTTSQDCDPSGNMEEFFKCIRQGQSAAEGPADTAPSSASKAPEPTAKSKSTRASADAVAAMMEALGTGPGLWHLRHDRSPITDTENVVFSLDSREVIPREYGAGEPASLIIQCRDNQTDVAITMADHWFYDEHQVVSRIDSKKAVRSSWIQSTDNKAAFHPSPIAFIRQLSSAAKLVVQTAPISSPSYTATFDLTGIGEILKPLRAACGW